MKCVTKFFSCVESELQKQAREQWDLVHADNPLASSQRKENHGDTTEVLLFGIYRPDVLLFGRR